MDQSCRAVLLTELVLERVIGVLGDLFLFHLRGSMKKNGWTWVDKLQSGKELQEGCGTILPCPPSPW